MKNEIEQLLATLVAASLLHLYSDATLNPDSCSNDALTAGEAFVKRARERYPTLFEKIAREIEST